MGFFTPIYPYSLDYNSFTKHLQASWECSVWTDAQGHQPWSRSAVSVLAPEERDMSDWCPANSGCWMDKWDDIQYISTPLKTNIHISCQISGVHELLVFSFIHKLLYMYYILYTYIHTFLGAAKTLVFPCVDSMKVNFAFHSLHDKMKVRI